MTTRTSTRRIAILFPLLLSAVTCDREPVDDSAPAAGDDGRDDIAQAAEPLTKTKRKSRPMATPRTTVGANVGNGCTAGLTISNAGNGPVMHGTVNVHLIWYGTVAGNVKSVLERMIGQLSESSYLALDTTYFDSSGTVTTRLQLASGTTDTAIAKALKLKGAPYSQGKKITQANVQTEVARAIQSGLIGSADPNAFYVVLASSNVTVSGAFGNSCTAYCGWHQNATISGQDVKYAFIPDCANCVWNATTPHGAKADGIAQIFTHELQETLTDPDINAWLTGSNTLPENADICAWDTGATTYAAAGAGGTANVHLGNRANQSSDDYLLSMQWVNQGGGFGAPAYGLPFWQQNYGYDGLPTGDWANGSYKAQCAYGQPVTGLAEDPSEGHAHSVLCGSDSTAPQFQQNTCHGVAFDPGNNDQASDPDWDPGFYKAQCRFNEFVAGVSQSLSGAVNGILCCTAGVGHFGCGQEVFYQTNSPGYRGPDWDYGFYKGECPQGQYATGVSAVPEVGVQNGGSIGMAPGAPHALRCCQAQ